MSSGKGGGRWNKQKADEKLRRAIRNEILEEAARVIDEGQETISSTRDGESRHLTQRREGNLSGLAYAAAIRALKT